MKWNGNTLYLIFFFLLCGDVVCGRSEFPMGIETDDIIASGDILGGTVSTDGGANLDTVDSDLSTHTNDNEDVHGMNAYYVAKGDAADLAYAVNNAVAGQTIVVQPDSYALTAPLTHDTACDIVVPGAEGGARAELTGIYIFTIGAACTIEGLDVTGTGLRNFQFVFTDDATPTGTLRYCDSGNYTDYEWVSNTNRFDIVNSIIGDYFCAAGVNEGDITDSTIGAEFCGDPGGVFSGSNFGDINNSIIGNDFLAFNGSQNGTIRDTEFLGGDNTKLLLLESHYGTYINCIDSAGVLFSTPDAYLDGNQEVGGTNNVAALEIGGVNISAIYQPLDATLTDIAGGTIGEDLDNTAHPWADNEVSDDITASGYVQTNHVGSISIKPVAEYDPIRIIDASLAPYPAISFHDSGELFEGAGNALYWRGLALYTTANDGTGSGLDADLLDGVEGAGYVQTNHTGDVTIDGALTAGSVATDGGADLDTVAGLAGSATQPEDWDTLGEIEDATGANIQEEPTEGAFVDGDKTKLDGIEALADVTDATNVEAAGALMDSEVANLAQVKAFDSSDYAPAIDTTTGAPSSATDTGTTGEIRYAGNYLYICIATDTWLRAQLITW